MYITATYEVKYKYKPRILLQSAIYNLKKLRWPAGGRNLNRDIKSIRGEIR